jgi:predicted ATPase
MEELIVKNFGAIKDIKISLKDLTIFIGKSGTGKSTLSKLIAIFRNIDFWNEVKSFDELFKEYQIQKFLQADTFISYKSDYLHITYKDTKLGKTNFSEKFIKEHKKLVELELVKKNTQDNIKENIKENINIISNYNIFQSIISQSFIIPAERLLASVLVESYAVLDKENIVRTLPKPLLDFVAEFNDISKTSNNYNIPIFDVSYKKGEDGLDYIVLPDKTELLLRFAASGMQTVIPALLILEHYAQNNETKKSFTFEEPELNLFPTAQKKLVEFMAEKVLNKGHQLVVCTHSDHILYSVLIECKKYDDGKVGIFNENTAIYYLRSDNNNPYLTEVQIEKGGRVRKFPDDFFDQLRKYVKELL